MIISMMFVPTKQQKIEFLNTTINIDMDILEQTQNTFVLHMANEFFDSSSQYIDQSIIEKDDNIKNIQSLFINKSLKTNIIISDNEENHIISIANIYLKGNIIKYNESIYGIPILKNEIQNVQTILHMTKEELKANIDEFIKTSIAPVLSSLTYNEWKVAFSLNGFLFYKKDLAPSIKPIDNIMYYSNFEDIVAIYKDEKIVYYDANDAFPEAVNHLRLQAIIGSMIVILFGGTYIIISDEEYVDIPENSENDDDEPILEEKENINNSENLIEAF